METTPIPVSASRGEPVDRARATEEARRAAYRAIVGDFFRPTRGQARWIDPRPLPDARGAADHAVEADDRWAAEIVSAVAHPAVCALEGDDAECRGRAGGVLRLSAAYAVHADTVIVFARYATVRAGQDPSDVVSRPDAHGPEMQFWLSRRGRDWRVVREATLQPQR